jgi:heme/copper-type cytochrome/quinol oxidase subunit 3
MKSKQLLPIIILFSLIMGSLAIINLLASQGTIAIGRLKIPFLMTVNGMLLLMSVVNYVRFIKSDTNNPNAMVRSVMLGTLLKLMVFAGSALAYAKQVKTPLGMVNLLIAMAFYMIFTWLEIKWVIRK